jgi:hypothetical protein
MAGKAREAERRPDAARATQAGGTNGGESAAAAEQAQQEQPAGRTATLNLPFVTAQFRAPELHAPSREDLGAAARGARSMLPSGKSLLFYGGLAATAVAGVIEWPVAAAIGVGTALANQGAASPAPSGQAGQPAEGTTTGTSRQASEQRA